MTTVPPLYYNNDPHSFGFATARSRWPSILDSVIKDVEATMVDSNSRTEVSQGKEIVQDITRLKEAIMKNGEIGSFAKPDIPGLQSYDDTLETLGAITWLTGPWLFCECYLYRRIDAYFKSRSEWVEFDPFESKKETAFRSSGPGIIELCLRYKKMSLSLAKQQNEGSITIDRLRVIFEELIDVSLWGNAIDLSLLANATLEDLQSRQGAEAIAKASKNVLCNDLPLAWNRLLSVPIEKRRVDFVLDNAGFELFTDIVLSLFLLDSKLTKKVVFHCKTRPWMVSDTMIKDYDVFFHEILHAFSGSNDERKYLVDRLHDYKASGKFQLVDSEFWTVDLDYWHLSPEETKYGGADLCNHFQDSALVIVKGDLNYRKLTGDRKWPRDVPFTTAIGKLAHSGIHILALRTCKADVCAGLPVGKDEELCDYWRSQGNKYGELWCSSGKWAVISYSSGEN
ncbi:hypothetical protein FOA43_003582 [Brettanomyces nanus]|uniref:Sugar phosphate phosphatase n=1 Tax=Eeniella nana TaxID=13502 RepID=A0A875S4F8_EENNA|nr:uncharacterized protein FOA43_003582 [Brettanomyces nanus]QPG76196.1 hypothetical protein FOA43_003582 [Brettanomyces nanus]